MHLKLTKVAYQWYRVLQVSNLYSNEREAYDKAVNIVNGVTLLSERNLNVLRNDLGRNSLNQTIVAFRSTDYSYAEQVFLTYNEFKNFFFHEATKFIKEHAGLQFYIDGGIINRDYKIVVYKASEVSYTGNIYKDTVPTMDVFHVYNVEKLDNNGFKTQKDKEAFLQEKLAVFINPMLEKLKGL